MSRDKLREIKAIGVLIPLKTPHSERLIQAWEAAAEHYGPEKVGLLKEGKHYREFYVEISAYEPVHAFIEHEIWRYRTCNHQHEVSSPIDTVEVCIKCGHRQPV